jgi:hypothetical protein
MPLTNAGRETHQFYENFFGRPGYHLFFSTYTNWVVKTQKDVLYVARPNHAPPELQ